MNPSTTRQPVPSALTRAGRLAAALPNDPGLDRLLADTRINSTAKAIALTLVRNWAWSRPSCFPSDRTVAAKVGKSPGHVQRCLRQLEAAGWIARERTPEVRSGRRIWLLWRLPANGAGAQPPPAPARDGSSAPARSERVVVEQEKVERAGAQQAPQRQRPEPPPPPLGAPLASPLARALGPLARSIDREAPISGGLVPPATPPRGPGAVSQPEGARRPAPPAFETRTVGSGEDSRASDRVGLPPAPPNAPARTAVVDTPGLSGLTAAEQARLWELPEPARRRVLQWVALGDPICLREARLRLRPPRPTPVAPATTAELLGRLGEDPSYPALAAQRLSEEFADPRSWSGYHALCTRVWRGELASEVLVEAYRQASGPQARNRGAVLNHAVRRLCRRE